MRRAAPISTSTSRMQDHGLFQAICRTNRLDGDDKDFGYIVDYKDLFKKVENAIAVYTSELDHSDRRRRSANSAAGPPQERPGTAGQCPGSPCAALRAGAAAQGRTGTHPLFLRQHRNSRRLARSTSHSASLSTRRRLPWCAPSPTLPTNWTPAGYSEADITRHQGRHRPLSQAAGDHPQGQRGNHRPESLRSRHAAPHRHLHRGRRAAKDFAVR